MSTALQKTPHDEEYRLALIAASDKALAEATELPDILELKNKAHAVQVFLTQQKFSVAIINRAKILGLKAERKAGKWLAGNVTQGGAQSNRAGTLPDGITRNQSSQAQKLAAIPEHKFNTYCEEKQAKSEPIRKKEVIQLSEKQRKADREEYEERRKRSAAWLRCETYMGMLQDSEPPSEIAASLRFVTKDGANNELWQKAVTLLESTEALARRIREAL